MIDAFICDAIRTPFGRYGGVLSNVRTDDLAAIPMRALLGRYPNLDWTCVDDIYYGCANQAGEDNRNVARMAALLAGLPESVPASTINRLCGSSLDAIGIAARAIRSAEAELVIAGGVESMTRAPFVMGKSEAAFSRAARLEDTTIGWRFVNPAFQARFGIDSMPETAEHLVAELGISREDQDGFALRSQERYAAANAGGFFLREIVPVSVTYSCKFPFLVKADEHPRPETTLETLGKLKGVVRLEGSITPGNASGIKDGSAAVLLASEAAARRYGPYASRSGGGVCSRGRVATHYGYGPRTCHSQAPRSHWIEVVGDRRHRAQRGLRGPSARCAA